MPDVVNAPGLRSDDARSSLESILPGLLDGLRIIATRRLGNVDDAEDAVQESVTRLIAAIHAGKIGTAAEIRPVAYGILRNVIVDELRSRDRAVDLVEVADPARGALEALIRKEQLDAVREVVGRLERADQDLLHRCFVLGERIAQIAAESGQPAERLRQRKSRAIRRLAALLGFSSDRSRSTADPDVES